MQKARRGFPLSQQYGEEFLRNAVRFFFCINERTPEKEEILRDILLSNPQNTRIMEHVIKQQRDGQQVRLTAEKGWLLKSKKSGKTYREIETLDLKRWEAVEDPDYVKPEVKPEPPTFDESQGTPAPAESKPKTAKRTNRKGK